MFLCGVNDKAKRRVPNCMKGVLLYYYPGGLYKPSEYGTPNTITSMITPVKKSKLCCQVIAVTIKLYFLKFWSIFCAIISTKIRMVLLSAI